MRFGEMIERRRLEEGLTQEELGERLGVSQATVGQWEHGRSPRRTNRALLQRIADFIGRPYVEILTLVSDGRVDRGDIVSAQLDQVLSELQQLNARVLVLEAAGGGEGDEYAPRDSNPEPNDSELPAAATGRGAVILPWPRRARHPELRKVVGL